MMTMLPRYWNHSQKLMLWNTTMVYMIIQDQYFVQMPLSILILKVLNCQKHGELLRK
ncbi:uncharacterized protein LOC108736120 isoform X2 [Agrilus planipennis]|uniref:Uncharacterized protein LOC108736120 isoform X2 n=1 Tax=Agrilus planipennis TaxID=224129 RepID=A0A1W4WJ13_AGRPL|nr:uncharacterized protein LOC108736120 isoform X2 [Agrilus planipennis]